MVAPPNAAPSHPASASARTGAASSSSTTASQQPRSKPQNLSNSSQAPPIIPLSARRADPLDLSTVERRGKSSAWREPPARTHMSGIPEAPTFRPTEDEWANPMEYMRSIYKEGSKYGIIKIIPPDGWNPDFAIDTERFHFRTRKQELNTCEGGTRSNLDYLDQLCKFHKSQGGVMNRFPSVDKRPLDLYELKKAVESRGGFERVCKQKKWAEIGRILGYSGKIMSSLSTSLKNSYAKWLEPYERFLQGAKPAVQWQLEQERGGPYATPSPGTSPMRKSSSQHTPVNFPKHAPAMRATEALNDSLNQSPPSGPFNMYRPVESAPPPQPHPAPPPQATPAVSSVQPQVPPPSRPVQTGGFTAMNTGGFTAMNTAKPAPPAPPAVPQPPPPPAGYAPVMEKPRPEDIRPNSNGFGSFQTLQSFAPVPNGYAPHDLKRPRSEDTKESGSLNGEDLGRSRKRVKKEYTAPTVTGSQMHQPRPSAPRSLGPKESSEWKPGDYCVNCNKGDDDKNILICDGCYKGFHTYCLDPPLRSIPDFDWHCPKCLVGTGEFGFEEGATYSLKQFQERARSFKEAHFVNKTPFDPILDRPRPVTEDDVEREFWRLVASITETVEVEYGADIHSTTHGSGFPTIERNPRDPYSTEPWNLNILPLHQESLFRYIKSDISGMTVPWLYVGMVFSTFCWHNEDHYSYSANYQHFGSTKTWYGIPGEDAERFEQAMRDAVPELFEKQPDLLFQLVTLLSPEQLKKAGVNVYAIDQRAGQLVITFPQAYHAGFNHGFNFNEAVNFAPSDWEPFGESGVERLRDFRRQPCFSHDELLLTAASSKDISIKTAKWLAPALERMYARESSIQAEFEKKVEDGKFVRPRLESDFRFQFERKTDNEDLPEEQYICSYCKTFSFLSRFTCDNSKKVACLDHLREVDCCHKGEGHVVHLRMTNHRLEQLVSKVSEKSRLPEAWVDKFETAISESPKPQLKTLRSLLSEGERIPWPIPELSELRKFVEKCNEWVEEATNYITRKQQNRRKNEKAWRKSSKASQAELEERDRELRKLENIQKLLDEADYIGFDCPEIATLQDRADAISDFQKSAREALSNISSRSTQQIEDLIELGRGFNLEIPELEHLDKVARQMRWKDKAEQRDVRRTIQETEDLIQEASQINVPDHNEHLLWLKDQKLRGEMWDKKANELMSVECIHFPQLEALAKQSADLPSNPDTTAKMDGILKKQREVQDRIKTMYEKTKAPDLRDRPLYKDVNPVFESIQELQSKPIGTMDLEREQRRHEDWMRKGKRLFGKTNAPLPILHQHLKIIDERNKGCLDLSDKPRLPVEPSSRQASPDLDQDGDYQMSSSRDIFCLCRKPESGMMIECHVCHEWYHSKCLKIARGKVKEDDDFVCPICDWTVKIPRDAARPKLEEMMAIQAEISELPFQPDEEETIASIVDTAQAFRDHMQLYIHNPAASTDEIPMMRFWLRKIEGADILLSEETNFFRQKLHEFVPIAERPPPIVEISNSTRKPRPTKQQKLMAQHGVSSPDDLPPDLRTKAYQMAKRKERDKEEPKEAKKQRQEPRPAPGPHAPGYTRHPGSAGRGRPPSRGHAHSASKPSGAQQANTSQGGGFSFRPPLTANAFPRHHMQDNRLGPRGSRQDSPLFAPGSAGQSLSNPPSATFPPLGSPYGSTEMSPSGPNPNLDPSLLGSGSPASFGPYSADGDHRMSFSHGRNESLEGSQGNYPISPNGGQTSPTMFPMDQDHELHESPAGVDFRGYPGGGDYANNPETTDGADPAGVDSMFADFTNQNENEHQEQEGQQSTVRLGGGDEGGHDHGTDAGGSGNINVDPALLG